ncbi:MAG: amidohydrolase [Clostridiales bacterium]|nr:amidohydrolase [Clostridiales bacterium]
MLIDFHVHVFPDQLAPRALNRLLQVNRVPCYSNGTLADTEAKMKEWGVDQFVSLNIATKPTQQTDVNNWAAAVQKSGHIGFGSVHPDAADAVEELFRIQKLGLSGVKLHPDYQNFFVDDPKLFPIYDALSELGLPVVFHAGLDPISPHRAHCPPAALASVLRKFPRMKVIAAHLGGMVMYREAEEFLAGKNLYMDLSMCVSFCSLEQFERTVRKHGAQRILFASDCPWSRPSDEFAYVERSSLSSAEKESIYWKNAAQLLNLSDLS